MTITDNQIITGADYAYPLMHELQKRLYLIARMAEAGGDEYLGKIQAESEASLKLLDSFNTCTAFQLGQTELALDNLGVGSVLHHVAYEVRKYTGQPIKIVNKTSSPVSANKKLLDDFLFSVGYFIAKASGSGVIFQSKNLDGGLAEISIYAKGFNIKQSDIHTLQDNNLAVMSLPTVTDQNTILLSVAKVLASFMNTSLKAKRTLSGHGGIAITLPHSQQLSLI